MLFDILILVIFLWAGFTGWRNGLLKELVSSLGFIVGLIIAALCYSHLSTYLSVQGSETNIALNIVAFFLLWIIIPVFLGFVANTLTKALSIVCLGWMNSLAGLAVSIIKYLLLLSCVLNAMSMLGIVDEERKSSSRLFVPVENVIETLFHEAKEKAKKEALSEEDTIWIDLKNRKDSVEIAQ